MATSASPECMSTTLSVPITSRVTCGRTFFHRARRGTSHRLANAFVVVIRRGWLSPPRFTALIALAKASRPSRITGNRRAPASVNDKGLGLRRNKAHPQSYLMADRRWRHAQLRCGSLEAQVPCRGFEGTQLDEGWKLGHASL